MSEQQQVKVSPRSSCLVGLLELLLLALLIGAMAASCGSDESFLHALGRLAGEWSGPVVDGFRAE